MNIVEEILTNSLPLLHSERIKTLTTYQLVQEANILDYPVRGIPIYTPYGLKIFKKFETLIHQVAQKYGLKEMLLSILQPQELFNKSGRYKIFQDGIFTVQEKPYYILSPTSEEQIISFLSSRIRSYRALPLFLYQIRQLFRDNSAHGVTRNKEFIVFESYSFHPKKENLIESFQLYDSFFKEVFSKLSIKFFTNNKYEESNYVDYLFLTEEGEYKFTEEMLKEKITNFEVKTTRASSIAMGMIVDNVIGERLNFQINNGSNGLQQVYVGTFGLGLIRALTAIIEQQRDEKGINLPLCLQPYSAIFIPEKHNDYEGYHSLISYLNGRADIVIDNRKCDRRYKINNAFFMGIKKVIYSVKDSSNENQYCILHRNGHLDKFTSFEQLDNFLTIKK